MTNPIYPPSDDFAANALISKEKYTDMYAR
ncbi:hypothetical protein B30_17170, partial [Celeribacter baekdonensis B30]